MEMTGVKKIERGREGYGLADRTWGDIILHDYCAMMKVHQCTSVL